MEPIITLPASLAAVMLDLVETVSKPMSTGAVVDSIQRSEFLLPLLEQAFLEQGIDPDEIERPELPPLMQFPS
jgi:hypothetical protein